MVGSVLALTLEGTTIRMPAAAGADAAFQYSAAGTLRFVFPFDPIYRVQPGVTVAVPIGADAGLAIAFDVQIVGGGTHDPLWHRPANAW